MDPGSIDNIIPDVECRRMLANMGRTKWADLDRRNLLPKAVKIYGKKQGRLASEMAIFIADRAATRGSVTC